MVLIARKAIVKELNEALANLVLHGFSFHMEVVS